MLSRICSVSLCRELEPRKLIPGLIVLLGHVQKDSRHATELRGGQLFAIDVIFERIPIVRPFIESQADIRGFAIGVDRAVNLIRVVAGHRLGQQITARRRRDGGRITAERQLRGVAGGFSRDGIGLWITFASADRADRQDEKSKWCLHQ